MSPRKYILIAHDDPRSLPPRVRQVLSELMTLLHQSQTPAVSVRGLSEQDLVSSDDLVGFLARNYSSEHAQTEGHQIFNQLLNAVINGNRIELVVVCTRCDSLAPDCRCGLDRTGRLVYWKIEKSSLSANGELIQKGRDLRPDAKSVVSAWIQQP